MKEATISTEPIGQNLIKLISNVCFSVFVFTVLIFTVIAITYQPPDPWLESSRALTRTFTQVENATFQTDTSVLKTGEDLVPIAVTPAVPSSSLIPITEEVIEKSEEQIANSSLVSSGGGCEQVVNCSDPRVLIAVERFNLRFFKSVVFLEFQTPVNGSKDNECDVGWRFRNKKEKSWRKYRDFRRFRFEIGDNCTYKIAGASGWHSGTNARRPRYRGNVTKGGVGPRVSAAVHDEEINDTIPVVGSDTAFRKGRYLYYARSGDYCKGMNHFLWSFLCGLGEAQYLNRTFVMDLSICLAAKYTLSNKDEEGKDFRYYFDFEHLKEMASIVEEEEFLRDWKKWDKMHKRKILVRKVKNYKITPMQLRKDRSSTIIWRQFDAPEPENYWYRVCEGQAAKYIQRPWHALWKSKRLMNIVSEISGRMDWDFDAVHVVRGEKAQNKELWPHLDSDTSPDAILAKLKEIIPSWRHVYVATNEPFYNYFDKLRSQYHVHLLDDYKELWSNTSEWFNETKELNGGHPVDFDGYMRVAVDTEVLYRAKMRVETFYNLTSDCKDGINTC
ncbi:GDP-fucose protein O-fucosyltransferase [Dillenia turbinata]|uniref:GDP-fucose protein O-fucosyltransferase n=1 Tax=Dillenia turbinata TaxID=194707 RepID=A0AAN8VE18_9MAGN